ncbi:MAG: aminotransferase class I/II-fold pyridoxal phosphate-dependent enzyme [Spirochaetaceae bacterium]
MISFKNDYSDGGHPDIIKALGESFNNQQDGYGEDIYTAQAIKLLKDKIGSDDVDIHFIAGGTLTNLLTISSFLRPHEAVISPKSGHIYVHETGAIEATGHKVFPIETTNGKISPEQVESVVIEHHFEHMVKPKLVYISQSTEIGTIYSKAELIELRKICDRLDLYLFVDGARLGSALTSKKNDLTLTDFVELTDAFYIGGTKNGAMLGEALVISNNYLKKDFRYLIKQKGAMLAKGRILGIQFLTLFKNDLYFDLARHANIMAKKLQDEIIKLGLEVQFKSYTNQIFPILPNKIISRLEKHFGFYIWSKIDDKKSSIRLVTSWITDEKDVDKFISDLKNYIHFSKIE